MAAAFYNSPAYAAMLDALRANLGGTRYSIGDTGLLVTSDKGETGTRVVLRKSRGVVRVRFESAKFGGAWATMPYTEDAVRRYVRRQFYDDTV